MVLMVKRSSAICVWNRVTGSFEGALGKKRGGQFRLSDHLSKHNSVNNSQGGTVITIDDFLPEWNWTAREFLQDFPRFFCICIAVLCDFFSECSVVILDEPVRGGAIPFCPKTLGSK